MLLDPDPYPPTHTETHQHAHRQTQTYIFSPKALNFGYDFFIAVTLNTLTHLGTSAEGDNVQVGESAQKKLLGQFPETSMKI